MTKGPSARPMRDECPCDHARLKQTSEVVAETFWTRSIAGGYDPEPAGPICLSRIVSEETLAFVCVDCGAPAERV
jgi:hypothetical protein